MALTPFTDSLNIIQGLADEPNNTLTAQQLKAKFDQAVLTIQDYINNTLIPELEAGIGLMSDVSAIDQTTLSNRSDHIPSSAAVRTAMTGATASRLYSSIDMSLYGGVTGTVNTDLSTDVSMNVSSVDPGYLDRAVPINKGGTGSTDVVSARTALGLSYIDIAKRMYPIGALFLTTSNTDPVALFGFGSWAKVKDRFLLAAGDTYSNGQSGGEAAHTLTIAEMPNHNHTLYDQIPVSYSSGGYALAAGSSIGIGTASVNYTGGGSSHNNMPPYLAVNVWQRTA